MAGSLRHLFMTGNIVVLQRNFVLIMFWIWNSMKKNPLNIFQGRFLGFNKKLVPECLGSIFKIIYRSYKNLWKTAVIITLFNKVTLQVYNLSFLKSSPVSFEKFAEHLLWGSHLHGCRCHLQKTPPGMKEKS